MVAGLAGCPEKDIGCGGYGTLNLTNSSAGTTQKILVDGIDFGTITPGQIIDVRISVGTHTLEMKGVSGGRGCSPGSVITYECETKIYNCPY
jgi:hypothetical protein